MRNLNDGKEPGLKELMCGIAVLVFTLVGLAKLADRIDINVSKNATIADGGCGGSNQNQACNKSGGPNRQIRRISRA